MRLAPQLTSSDRNYPQDARLNEFVDFEVEIKMQRRVNSLSRRLRRMGDSGVTPVELSFVEALNLRDQDQDLAIQRLRDLLVVYQDRSWFNSSRRRDS